VLGGGPAQRHAIQAAAAAGLRAVVCDADPAVADIRVSTEDLEGVVRAATRCGAAGLIAPGTDWPVRIAAEAAEQLRLPHPITAAVARTVTDKLAQRRIFADAGVPQPAWSTDGPPGYPCVVKAPDVQGQRSMSVVETADDLAGAVQRARAGSRAGGVLYETLVPGAEVTFNGFIIDGVMHHVMVADRIHFPDAFGVAMMHVFPPRAGAAEAAALGERAMAALGVQHGPVYVQIVLGPEGPVVIEAAARLGGGHDSELARQVTGADLALAAVLAAVARPVDPRLVEPHPRGAGAIGFLRAPAGTLRAASGPAGVRFYHGPGHRYAPLRVATDRAGYVLVTAADREEAVLAARTAIESVSFEVT
jgi:biotin carboxylase